MDSLAEIMARVERLALHRKRSGRTPVCSCHPHLLIEQATPSHLTSQLLVTPPA